MLDGSHDGTVVGRYAAHRDVGAPVVGTAVAGSPLVAIAVVGICEVGSRVVGASDVASTTVCGPAVGAPLGIGAAMARTAVVSKRMSRTILHRCLPPHQSTVMGATALQRQHGEQTARAGIQG